MFEGAVYAPVALSDKEQRAYWEAYKGAKIRQEEWDSRQPIGPYMTVGKSYSVFRHIKCNTHSFVEVLDDFGKFTVLPACHLKGPENK